MPAIINSAPDCVTHVEEASADDMADFILQANYQDCAGFMTFGPGSTYGEGGHGGGDRLLRADRARRSRHGRGVRHLDRRREPAAGERSRSDAATPPALHHDGGRS